MEDFENGSNKQEIGIFQEIGIGDQRSLFGKVQIKNKKFVLEVKKNFTKEIKISDKLQKSSL